MLAGASGAEEAGRGAENVANTAATDRAKGTGKCLNRGLNGLRRLRGLGWQRGHRRVANTNAVSRAEEAGRRAENVANTDAVSGAEGAGGGVQVGRERRKYSRRKGSRGGRKRRWCEACRWYEGHSGCGGVWVFNPRNPLIRVNPRSRQLTQMARSMQVVQRPQRMWRGAG